MNVEIVFKNISLLYQEYAKRRSIELPLYLEFPKVITYEKILGRLMVYI